MGVYIAFLRAVNLGGSTKIRMPALRAQVTRLGFEQVRTVGQTGNVVFESDAPSADGIESTLCSALTAESHRPLEVFVRSSAEWHRALWKNPFRIEAAQDPSHLVIAVLKEPPPSDRWAALKAASRGPERIVAGHQEAYLYYPNGIGRSPLTSALLESQLGTRCTNRNWNTASQIDRSASD